MSTPDTRSLREVRREQAAERRRLREQRSLAMDRRENTRKESDNKPFILKSNAIVTGLVPRISGAIDSWAGKRVPLSVEHPAHQFYAYTDFNSITISIPPLREDQEMTVDFAADLRGLAYHEAGHILMTVPFGNILDAVMPIDAVNHSTYQRDNTLNQVWGSKDQLHHAWNMLEDQRMETAMTVESKNLGRYYNVIVLAHVLEGDVSPNAYLLLYGRKHVDATVRASARAAFVAVQGEEMAQEAERLIDAYCQAGDYQTMWECVVRFSRLVEQSNEKGGDPGELDGHGDQSLPGNEADSRKGRSQATPGQNGSGDQDDEGEGEGSESDEDGDADGESDDDEAEADKDDPSSGGTADRTKKGANAPGGGAADDSISDPQWNRDFVRDAIRDAKEARNSDRTITNDIRAFNEALGKAGHSLPIHRIPTAANPDPAVTFEATKLNRSLRVLMEQARAEQAPSWQTQQRRGVLDVMRYKTRQAGDMEFYRDYADGGDMHLPNMAVSLVLDGSGSMNSYNEALAKAAFGVKSACDVVGVPCTVTVYDTDAYLLWDQDDRPIEVPLDVVPGGGTDPKRALDLLDNQMADKDHHLVILMTDGQWGGRWQSSASLDQYMVPNRDIVMFFWNTSPTVGPKGVEQCSTVARINSLDEMPNFLRRYVLRAM